MSSTEREPNDWRGAAGLVLLVALCGGELRAAEPDEYTVDHVVGRVVWLSEALSAEWGIETVPGARERELAFRSDEGRIVPLIEDLRVRAFRTDPRLREMHVCLRVRRYSRTPWLQVLKIYELGEDGQLQQVDYWCDVCAIVMFEDGPCACCQQPNRLRKRPVSEEEAAEILGPDATSS